MALSEQQRGEVIELIRIGLTEQASEQRAELARVRGELQTEGENFARQNSEYQLLHEAYSAQIAEKQRIMEDSIRQAQEARTTLSNALTNEFSQKQGQIDALVQKISEKQGEMEHMKNAIEVMIGRSEESVRQQGGQWRAHVDSTIETFRAQTVNEIQSVNAQYSELSARIATLGELVRNGAGNLGGNSGSDESAPGSFANIFKKGLIDQRELRLPAFPERPEDAEQFKRWLKDFAKHCTRSGTYS